MKRLLLVAVALLGGVAAAPAQNFPSKPVTIVIPLPAGGAVDTMVRNMQDSLRASFGQPILIENVGGAGGTTGINRVARAAPDGYTISVGTWGTHVVNAFAYATPYDFMKDVEPVALLPSVPHWFIARKNLPPTNLRELIAYMKENAGKVTAGSVGVAGSSAICSYYFGKVAGATATLVPYRGGAPALQDIVAGNVDMMCDLAANSLAQVRAGNVKVYAVTAKKRWFAAPEVPTVDEAGAPGVYVTNWLAAYAPKGTPPDIVAKLNAAFNAAMADAAIRQRIETMGLEIPPPEQQTPEAFAAYLKAEMDKWGAIIRESGIKAQ
jgi:tripartite-type tricarboxylate transporter receptor subunit TctC